MHGCTAKNPSVASKSLTFAARSPHVPWAESQRFQRSKNFATLSHAWSGGHESCCHRLRIEDAAADSRPRPFRVELVATGVVRPEAPTRAIDGRTWTSHRRGHSPGGFSGG